MKSSSETCLYSISRPRAPPLEAALGSKAIDDEAALPRGAVGLAVHEALLGVNLAAPSKKNRTADREPVAHMPQLPLAHLPQPGARAQQRAAQPVRQDPAVGARPAVRVLLRGENGRRTSQHQPPIYYYILLYYYILQ